MSIEWQGIRGIFGALALALVACRSTSQPPSLTNGPLYERGLQLFPSPRTFDPPGTVFRVDPDGVRRGIVDLSGMLSLTPKEEAIPRMSATGLLRADLLLGWLGIAGIGQGGIQRVDTISLYVAGAKREQAFEVDLRRVTDSAAKIVDWKRPGKVYVITETVQGDTVDIGLSESLRATVGHEITADTTHRSGVDVTWNPQGSTQLRLRFDKPHRIFYKAERLVPRTGGIEPDSAGAVIRIQPDSAIVWQSESER